MKVKYGTYVGNLTDDRAISGVGFQPDLVIIKKASAASGQAVCRTSTMSGDNTKAIYGSVAIAANKIQSLDSDGFTIGTHSGVNASGATYRWLALQDDGADLSLLTYTGDGADNRSITGAGFQPDMVIVMSANAVEAVYTTSDMAAGDCLTFVGANAADRIQALEADGFQVGTTTNVNASGVVFHALCVKNAASLFKVLTYTGNGADGRSISGAGFAPDGGWTVPKSGTATTGAHRLKDHSGDSSSVFSAVADAADLIQALESDGFQVGTDVRVNENAISYYACYWKESVAGAAAVRRVRGLVV